MLIIRLDTKTQLILNKYLLEVSDKFTGQIMYYISMQNRV